MEIDEELLEKKKEANNRAAEYSLFGTRSRKLLYKSIRFLKNNPKYLEFTPYFWFLEINGEEQWGVEFPDPEFTEKREENIREMRKTEIKRRIKETEPEEVSISLQRGSDDLGEFFRLKDYNFVCRGCWSLKRKIRIGPDDKMVCDSCLKLFEITESLDRRIGKGES